MSLSLAPHWSVSHSHCASFYFLSSCRVFYCNSCGFSFRATEGSFFTTHTLSMRETTVPLWNGGETMIHVTLESRRDSMIDSSLRAILSPWKSFRCERIAVNTVSACCSILHCMSGEWDGETCKHLVSHSVEPCEEEKWAFQWDEIQLAYHHTNDFLAKAPLIYTFVYFSTNKVHLTNVSLVYIECALSQALERQVFDGWRNQMTETNECEGGFYVPEDMFKEQDLQVGSRSLRVVVPFDGRK